MKNQVFYCSIHTDEIITNYCCLMGCQTPLCPECIHDHNKRHKNNGVFPEIDTLPRVTKMCEKKSGLVIDELQELLEKLNSLTQFDVDSLQKQAKIDLDSMQQRMTSQLELFFDNLYKDYCSKISGVVKKVGFFFLFSFVMGNCSGNYGELNK